jgi:hypothetical protein
MTTQCYLEKKFTPESLRLIETMNAIVVDYVQQGYRLTVRQLYYQLVARAVVPNTEQSYKRITGIVNDAKLAGLMDWEAIEDRTREFIRRTRWESAASPSCARRELVPHGHVGRPGRPRVRDRRERSPRWRA